MKERIQQLMDEANSLYKQAMAILDEYDGKELPQEQYNQTQTLLDQVENKRNEAELLDRAARERAHLEEPATRLNTPVVQDRAPDPVAAEAKAQEAFLRYLRCGRKDMTLEERKDLVSYEDIAGGYLVPSQMIMELLRIEREASAIRGIARVLPPIRAGESIVPSQDSALSDATWTTKISTTVGNIDTTKPFGQRRLTPHVLAKGILQDNALLRNSMFDMNAWVTQELADVFRISEEEAFINGDGVQQPLGLLKAGLPIHTTSASNAVNGDDIIQWVYNLPATYARNASIVCNRSFIRKVRLLKDSNGNYIWQPGLQDGTPSRILDVPYFESDRFPEGLTADAWNDNAQIAVVGDFMKYWIVDSMMLSIKILDQVYDGEDKTGYHARKYTDGMPVMTEAFYILKVKA